MGNFIYVILCLGLLISTGCKKNDPEATQPPTKEGTPDNGDFSENKLGSPAGVVSEESDIDFQDSIVSKNCSGDQDVKFDSRLKLNQFEILRVAGKSKDNKIIGGDFKEELTSLSPTSNEVTFTSLGFFNLPNAPSGLTAKVINKIITDEKTGKKTVGIEKSDEFNKLQEIIKGCETKETGDGMSLKISKLKFKLAKGSKTYDSYRLRTSQKVNVICDGNEVGQGILEAVTILTADRPAFQPYYDYGAICGHAPIFHRASVKVKENTPYLSFYEVLDDNF